MTSPTLEINLRQQQVLYDKKWMIFLRRAWLFRFIPFVDFVFAAGSMATGDVDRYSDFDVIVGVRQGRIFTARFFTIFIFGFFWFRRARLSHGEAAADKICLNHFVTPVAYRLSPPYTDSWRELYAHLVPLFGDITSIDTFFAANVDWMGVRVSFRDDLRYDRSPKNLFARCVELIFNGFFGDLFERSMRRLQLWKIERSLRASLGVKPRIIVSDNELEFHPDRAKFENVFY